jgi:hypothetical protein
MIYNIGSPHQIHILGLRDVDSLPEEGSLTLKYKQIHDTLQYEVQDHA